MASFLVNQWWLVTAFVLSLIPLAMQIISRGVIATLRTLDRRWIFLLLTWAVLLPIYYIGVTGQTFPELPSALARATFDEIERLQPGDPVRVERFGQGGRIVRIDAKRGVAVVSVGLGQWEVSLEEVIPLER